jgi:hypothetical protein
VGRTIIGPAHRCDTKDEPMRTALWDRSVRRYVLPRLPGDWDVHGGILYCKPADWLLCAVVLHQSHWSSDFRHDMLATLLAVPSPVLTVSFFVHPLGHGLGRGHYTAVTSIAEAEPAMDDLYDLIQLQAIPYLDRVGTLQAYTAEAEAATTPENVNHHQELCYLRLIQGDIDGALQSAELAVATGHAAGYDWTVEIADRVAALANVIRDDPQRAVDLLRDNAAQMRARLKIVP